PQLPRQHRRRRAFARRRDWGSGTTANWAGSANQRSNEAGKLLSSSQSVRPGLQMFCRHDVHGQSDALSFFRAGPNGRSQITGIVEFYVSPSLWANRRLLPSASLDLLSQQTIKSKYPYPGEGYTGGTRRNGPV